MCIRDSFDNRLVRHEFQKHAGDRLAIRIYKRHRIFAVADSCRIYNLQEKEMDVGAGERQMINFQKILKKRC